MVRLWESMWESLVKVCALWWNTLDLAGRLWESRAFARVLRFLSTRVSTRILAGFNLEKWRFYTVST